MKLESIEDFKIGDYAYWSYSPEERSIERINLMEIKTTKNYTLKYFFK